MQNNKKAANAAFLLQETSKSLPISIEKQLQMVYNNKKQRKEKETES